MFSKSMALFSKLALIKHFQENVDINQITGQLGRPLTRILYKKS